MFCKYCGLKFPYVVMVGKICYLCALAEYPPKTQKQYRKYRSAVGIRLSLKAPLTKVQGIALAKKIGLDRLNILNEICGENVLPFKPCATFYQRVIDWAEDNLSPS